MVTGIVVNEKENVSAEYKAKIRQEMYYCMKYGVESHMHASNIDSTVETYVLKMLGKINYVLSVETANQQMRQYRNWLQAIRREMEKKNNE